jgi:two-component sensor histidine kinase
MTCFAAVLAATIWGGVLGGVLATVLCGLLANFTVGGPAIHFSLDRGHLWSLIAFFLMSAIVVVLADTITAATRREAALKGRLEVITRELQHRARNGITLAIALIQQTGKNVSSVEDFQTKIIERFQALARVQGLLNENTGERSSMTALVKLVLSPFDVDERITRRVVGSDVMVTAETAVALSLILNELATNAMKYGALSAPDGAVDLRWTTVGDTVKIQWKESGGPPVAPPGKLGFGSRLFRNALSQGKVDLHYEPDGVRCEIEFPAIEHAEGH